MPKYIVKIWQTKYAEHPCMTAYEIESWAEHDAVRQAKDLFQQDTGFRPEDTQVQVHGYKTITGPTIDTDHPDGEAIRKVLRKHGFGKENNT